MTARDPVHKDMAAQKKEARVTQAELDKQAAREHNAAKHSTTAGQMGHGTGTATYPTTGEYGQPVGAHHTSAMPGHGTGQPTGGHVTEGVTGSHPMGGTGTAHNTRAGGNPHDYGHGTGGTYN